MFEEESEAIKYIKYNLGYKDRNRIKEDIVFSCMNDRKISSSNDSKDIKLFQGATIMGVVEKDFAIL
jgi:hypothetical protein